MEPSYRAKLRVTTTKVNQVRGAINLFRVAFDENWNLQNTVCYFLHSDTIAGT